MRFVQVRARILAVAVVACACATACSNGPTAPHGSPILTKVFWVAGGTQFLVWSLDPVPALASPVPPFGSEVDFVFDRRLDGARIEDLVTVNGVTTARPKDPPAVRATWPDMANVMSDPPFALVVDYNSAPRFGDVTSYIFARPQLPGFPSSDTVSFEIVRAQVTSAYGEPATVPDSIPVKTAALSLSIGTSSAAVLPTFQVPLAFSNRLDNPPATSPFVHVTANGGAVPYALLADAAVSSRWYLAAAACLGGVWPANTTFTVTVDAGFPDAFGGKLAQTTTATFSTGASPGAAVDASCSIPGPITETPDAASGDGPVDAGASDAADAPAVDAD